MLAYVAAGTLLLALLLLLARWFTRASPSDLAQALRTFVAVFSTLAGTGLVLVGRWGLAFITVAAAVMAVRSLLKARRGADSMSGGDATGRRSSVTTDLLAMELDHATGELDGRVRSGPLAGRRLSEVGLSALLSLLETARRDDPPSFRLLEAYLDRREPGWRHQASGAPGAEAAAAQMDERRALAILGLAPGASAEDIKTAHRRLMAKLHPDHGGSDFLASEINRAKDFLLGKAG